MCHDDERGRYGDFDLREHQAVFLKVPGQTLIAVVNSAGRTLIALIRQAAQAGITVASPGALQQMDRGTLGIRICLGCCHSARNTDLLKAFGRLHQHRSLSSNTISTSSWPIMFLHSSTAQFSTKDRLGAQENPVALSTAT
jgi:hypothetical protein